MFVGFISYGSNGESTVAIGEVYESYNICWSWGYGCVVAYWGPKTQKKSGFSQTMPEHVVEGHVHCSSQFGNVIS